MAADPPEHDWEVAVAWVVTIIGLLLVAVAIAGVAMPLRLVAWVAAIDPWKRYWLAVGGRTVVGVLLVVAASACRWPQFVTAIGVIALASAVVLGLLGPARLQAFVDWWRRRAAWVTQSWCAVAFVFGALLVVAAG